MTGPHPDVPRQLATSPPDASAPGQADPAYASALAFLYDRINYEKSAGSGGRFPFRLQRMRTLLERLGLHKYLYPSTNQPVAVQQPEVPLVHIAGTKGKGSTSNMVAAILSQAGYRTGVYTSPHLHQLEERFQIDGQQCTSDQLVNLVAELQVATGSDARKTGISSAVDEDGYSFFELTTALALLHFDHSECDCIVLETGLGGRLDSTNVCSPSVTSITSIGLDHQHVLGNSLAEIATEKAGIIKTGVPLVCGVTANEPRRVIHDIAASKQAQVFQRGRDFDFTGEPTSSWGTSLRFAGRTPPMRDVFNLRLSLEGRHQAGNAAIALAIIDLLIDQGLSVSISTQQRALAGLQFPGRIERYQLSNQVLGIVDAAHNEDSIAALCAVLQDRRGDRPIFVVFGTSRDKNVDVMLDQLARVASKFVLTQFRGNPRFLPSGELVRWVPPSHREANVIVDDPIAACELGLKFASPGGILVVCGSFFLAAETRGWMDDMMRQSLH